MALPPVQTSAQLNSFAAMGCIQSAGGGYDEQIALSIPVSSFVKYSVAQLKDATSNFSPYNIVSESGERSQNMVFKGRLADGRLVAVKRFCSGAWPNEANFVDEARSIGRLRSERLACLLGCCCEANERLLVAEYMPNGTLATHLFQWKKKTIEWSMRLRVALYIAQALEQCSNCSHPLYHDLNAHSVLFDQDGNPKLSSFGLMKNSSIGKSYSTDIAYQSPEYIRTGKLTPASVIYSYGTILLDLISGKHIPPNHAFNLLSRNSRLVDSYLEGKYSPDDASEVVTLASLCLRHEPRERPNPKMLVKALMRLLRKIEVPSHLMMDISGGEENSSVLNALSPLAEACLRMDLTAVHKIMVMVNYQDDEDSDELSFKEWTLETQNMRNVRKHGDLAFEAKDFQTATQWYTRVINAQIIDSPTVYARRSLAYLFCGLAEPALRDAMHAEYLKSDWPTAFYLEAAALGKLEMKNDAADTVKRGATLEKGRRKPR